MEKIQTDRCRFCGAEFIPKDAIFGTLEKYLCPDCHDLVRREAKDAALEICRFFRERQPIDACQDGKN
ncbi:MAG: hypothetical protein QXR42_05650 [Candidatus Bathyarchaeia archaeon]